eukprot:SAG22_NODE_17136_length_311_cov_0.566038_1_plen_32_part_10
MIKSRRKKPAAAAAAGEKAGKGLSDTEKRRVQ